MPGDLSRAFFRRLPLPPPRREKLGSRYTARPIAAGPTAQAQPAVRGRALQTRATNAQVPQSHRAPTSPARPRCHRAIGGRQHHPPLTIRR
ncbi:hypothetical protein AZ78_1117 [Lysobacter capsici AZ78]|uniref:Uncharacterized protein n=1 Tax=Lysobacter capsici AZ78 TaxID=1444315 RepID=A0A108U6R1_9GAMM|nr:hypothetical protein AZ78_1117 [Lysobacter capsici AZ78]